MDPQHQSETNPEKTLSNRIPITLQSLYSALELANLQLLRQRSPGSRFCFQFKSITARPSAAPAPPTLIPIFKVFLAHTPINTNQKLKESLLGHDFSESQL